MQRTHLWPFSKSKFNLKSDRVNLVAPASLIHWARYSTNWDRKGWPGSEIQMYYGCPWGVLQKVQTQVVSIYLQSTMLYNSESIVRQHGCTYGSTTMSLDLNVPYIIVASNPENCCLFSNKGRPLEELQFFRSVREHSCRGWVTFCVPHLKHPFFGKI